jgi:hypothetical protein
MTDYKNLAGGQSDTFVVQSAATTPVAGSASPRSWLEFKHPEYLKYLPRWKMTEDFYHGEVADKEVARNYLIRRFQGEPDQAYNERVKVSDFTPHLGTLIDTLAGMLYATEDRTSRVWMDEEKKGGLGDPNEVGTPAHRLAHDADGQGTAWKTLWREFTLDIINYQCMWVLVDTIGGIHYVKLVSPMQVPNWLDGPHGPTSVLMKEYRDTRTSLEESPDRNDTFIRWDIGGWSRWRLSKEGVAIQLEGTENSGTYTYKNRNGTPALPIFKVHLPMRRYVAWLLANKAAVLFNHESVRDFGLRIANFTKLVLGVSGNDQAEQLLQKILKGENVLAEDEKARGGHRFIAPSSEPTKNASEVLDKKVEHFWISGFKMYEDAAAQKTATEVKQDVAAGIGAFLQLLAAAVDDAENGAFYRLEQAEHRTHRRLLDDRPWGGARPDEAAVHLGWQDHPHRSRGADSVGHRRGAARWPARQQGGDRSCGGRAAGLQVSDGPEHAWHHPGDREGANDYALRRRVGPDQARGDGQAGRLGRGQADGPRAQAGRGAGQRPRAGRTARGRDATDRRILT